MVRSFVLALCLVVGLALPTQAQAQGYMESASNWLDNHHVPFPPPEVPLSSLYVRFSDDAAPVRVTDIILAPVHTGASFGPKLQLPQQISLRKLVRTARALSIYDLNGDDWLDRSELTQGLLAWAITSEADRDFGRVSYFYSSTAGMQPLDRFVLNYDDSAYVRRAIVQHGHTGSADLLSSLAEKS